LVPPKSSSSDPGVPMYAYLNEHNSLSIPCISSILWIAQFLWSRRFQKNWQVEKKHWYQPSSECASFWRRNCDNYCSYTNWW
jgi:hypothetical protein